MFVSIPLRFCRLDSLSHACAKSWQKQQRQKMKKEREQTLAFHAVSLFESSLFIICRHTHTLCFHYYAILFWNKANHSPFTMEWTCTVCVHHEKLKCSYPHTYITLFSLSVLSCTKKQNKTKYFIRRLFLLESSVYMCVCVCLSFC